jgi:hypothetical protein
LWSEPSKGGFAEMRIRRNIVFRSQINIGKIAPSAAGSPDLFPDLVHMIEHQD